MKKHDPDLQSEESFQRQLTKDRIERAALNERLQELALEIEILSRGRFKIDNQHD